MSDKSSPKQFALGESSTAAGFAFLRFDHRGCGQSEGRFVEDTSLEGRCTDLSAAIDHVRELSDLGGEVALFGSSFGGTVSLATAAKVRVTGVVSYAAPIRGSFPLDDPSTGKPRGKSRLRFDIERLLPRINSVFVLHGDRDEVVPIEHGLEIYRRVSRPKQMTLQRGGDHLMQDPKHQARFLVDAIDWFRSCFKASGR